MTTLQRPLAIVRRQDLLLVVLMTISAVSLFAIFPYFTLYLKQQFQLSEARAGLLVGSIALISSVGAWFGGAVVDRCGWLRVLRASALAYVAVFALLAVTVSVEAAAVLACLLGVCRMFMEPALKTALVLHDDGSGRLFKWRYLTMVAGATVGPLLSAALEPFGPQAGFGLALVGFAAYALLAALLVAPPQPPVDQRLPPGPIDRRAVLLLIALGFVFFVGFSQYETTLALRLDSVFAPAGADVYRAALLINAALALPMMAATERALSRWPLSAQVALGVLALAASMALLFGSRSSGLVYLGAVLFTLGEVILFPLPDIAAARLTTPENRGRLLGLVDLRYLGFFAGPALGGALLEHAAPLLVVVLCLSALAIHPLFRWSMGRPA